MILRILAAIFPQVRALQSALGNLRMQAATVREERKQEADAAAESVRIHEAHAQLWRDRCEAAEARADAASAKLTDALMTAGDSMALRATGRRLFSKAPVEPPPSDEQRQPLTLGAKPFAGDVAKRETAKFHRSLIELAQEAGVTAPPKPN